MLEPGDKVYVCGKITDLPEEHYMENFRLASNFVSQMGFVAVNPLKVIPDCNEECKSGLTFEDGRYMHDWRCYMRADIIALMGCKGIFAQPNAVRSTGALLELQLARSLGMSVLNYSDGGESDAL